MIHLRSSCDFIRTLQINKPQVAMGALTCAIAIFQHYANRYISDEKKLAVNVAYIAALAFAGNALIKTKKLAFIPALLLAIKVVSPFFGKKNLTPKRRDPDTRPTCLQTVATQYKSIEIIAYPVLPGTSNELVKINVKAEGAFGLVTEDELRQGLSKAFPGKALDKLIILKDGKKIDEPLYLTSLSVQSMRFTYFYPPS